MEETGKITIFMSALSGGGAERVTCNLANYLSNFGHEVEILTMGDTAAAEPLREGIRHLPLLMNAEKKNAIINNLKRIFRLRKYMKEQIVDAYVVMLPVTTELMLRFSSLTNAPIIVSERADPKVYAKKTQRILRNLASRASGFVFQTKEVKAWYESYLKGIDAVVIPNPIAADAIPLRHEGERRHTVVGVGRLDGQKNFEMLISDFSKLPEQFSDYTLEIYGGGAREKELQEHIEVLGLQDRALLMGVKKGVMHYIADTALYVMSSNFEGFPNALVEAMATGLPVISTDFSSGVAKDIVGEENGIVIPVGDKTALVEAMTKMLSDENRWDDMSRTNRELLDILSEHRIMILWNEALNLSVQDVTAGGKIEIVLW